MTQPWVIHINVWSIVPIQVTSELLQPGHKFWMQVYSDLEYYLGQGHDTQGHGYQFMEYHYPIDVTSEILAWT